MRLCYYFLSGFTYLICVGFYINPTVAANREKTPSLLEIAQANSFDRTSRSNLGIGAKGEDVKALQTQLKKLGYYDDITDGQFGITTRNAVTQFQRDNDLLPDGIAGSRTRKLIKTETLKQIASISPSTPEPVSETSSNQQKSSKTDWIQLGLIAMGIFAGAGILFYIVKYFNSRRLNSTDIYLDDDTELVKPSQDKLDNANQEEYLEEVKPSLDKLESAPQAQEYIPNNGFDDVPQTITSSPRLLPPAKNSSLLKINVVDELIQELESSNPTKKRKAIWELGQKGDSRAIQPLVEQIVHSDSQQRSLILAALSEIGTRTLKPMNQALAMSIQDESPEVRKNAIRDLTRVITMMAQISKMLSMAVEDDDPEVQKTAKYAISQMNRIRILTSEEPETQIQKQDQWQDTDN